MKNIAYALLISCLFSNIALAEKASTENNKPVASVYFISPNDSAVVSSPFTVEFGLKGMGVAPAGVDKANTGHHHLLIDVDQLPAMDKPLPATEKIRHFGGGQTQTQLELAPGKHTLQLVLGNYLHTPHAQPVMSQKITIMVK